MDISWHITEQDKACVKAILEKQSNSNLVRDRYEWNLAVSKPTVTKEKLWEAMVCMRLTTRAQSGPESKVAKFQSLSPFPLAYENVLNESSREDFIRSTLRTHKVGTDPVKIAKELAQNFEVLENGEWEHVLAQCNKLVSLQPRETEAEVADYISDKFDGFGPKQSRNVLQELRLTRYEIPIDSRVTEWLNDELKFPFKVTATALADRHYYNLILDAICKLCEECHTFPCILDASIFSAKDDKSQASALALASQP